MAKLDPDFLEGGRRLVRRKNLDGLMGWVERSGTIVDHEVTRKTFEVCFRAGDTGKAMKIFNAAFSNSDPAREKAVMLLQFALIGLTVLGVFGGLLYLVSLLHR